MSARKSQNGKKTCLKKKPFSTFESYKTLLTCIVYNHFDFHLLNYYAQNYQSPNYQPTYFFDMQNDKIDERISNKLEH